MSTLEVLSLPAPEAARATLIAIPGIMETVAAMRPTLQHWAETGLDVVAINPRGHGKSARWTQDLLDRHPGDVIVEDVLDYLATAPLRRDLPLVLFGHSAGGAAIAAVAARLSPRPAALVLEDPFWRLPVTPFQDTTVARNAAQDLLRLKALSCAGRHAEILERQPHWPEDELVALSSAKQDMDVSVVENGHVIPSVSWPTLVGDLVGAGVPVHVITGTIRTGMTANHRAILRSLGAEVTVLRGATHFIRRNDRERFHVLVGRLLDRYIQQEALSPSVAADLQHNRS